jgi:DNA-nicking Smr family endonuclease
VKKKPTGKGGRKEPVSSDEDLWHHTAATIEPLKRGKPRVHLSGREPPETSPSSKRQPKAPDPIKPAIHKAPKNEATNAGGNGATRRAPPDLATFDRNSVRKIRLGHIDIEARVDLHGMRQGEAHAALRSFLLRCQNRGLRYVLVITGKGKATSRSESPYGDYESERGVLKRNVPRWLEEPEIRSIVVSYTTAAIHHGGEGAIYIHLRSKTRV